MQHLGKCILQEGLQHPHEAAVLSFANNCAGAFSVTRRRGADKELKSESKAWVRAVPRLGAFVLLVSRRANWKLLM